MKNLSISIKLALGFGVVIVMLLLSGGIAYYSLSENYKSFTEYRGLARDTNLMGGVQANLLMVRMNVKDFLITDSEKDKQEFAKYMGITRGFMTEASEEIKNPERAALVAEADKLLGEYEGKFVEVESIQAERNTQVAIMDRVGPSMESKLSEVMRSAFDDEDVTAAYYAGAALRSLMIGRLYAGKYLQNNKMSAVERFEAEFKELENQMIILDREVQNFGRRELLGEVAALKKEYSAAFGSAVDLISRRNNLVSQGLDKIGPAIASDLEKAKLSVKKDQDILGPQVQQQSEEAQSTVGLLSVAAGILGILAGIYISRSVSVPLSRATDFADAVSSGDFDRSIDIDQKDEVGRICSALNKIKETVSGAADEVEGIVSRVERGEMTAKGDESHFSGGFAKLVDGVNTLVNVYSGFLDQLPVGVMSLTPEFKPVYLNETAKKVGGVDALKDRKCFEIFNTDDCNTENCASKVSMKNKASAESTTVSRTATGEYHISYSSLPLMSRSGEVLGAAEIIIDQTEIKKAQETMLEVAGKANDIADRVASASEELAAQVEQVSNGSEIQQQRVSETATAMEEMNSSVLEIARNASEAREQSDNSTEKAGEGSELVNKVVDAINRVNSVATDLQNDMENLGEQAKAIGGVMNVITDIADQTNLLALNAAIEAARAGEAGRGFAVVADEVRKLAEKTMDATTEVGNNIKGIQSATDKNLTNVTSAVGYVGQATELANNSGDVLREIVRLATGSSELIGGIATAAEEQSATSEQINRAVDEVNRIVAETTDGMVQSATAVQELAEMALDLKSVLNSLNTNKS